MPFVKFLLDSSSLFHYYFLMLAHVHKLYGKKSSKNIIIFLGFGLSQKYGPFLGRLFSAYGYQAHVYYYSSKIIGDSAETFEKNTEKIIDSALKIITADKKKKNEWYVFGTSFGSIMALALANKSPKVKKTVLNLCPFNLAETISSWSTKNALIKEILTFKKSLIKKSLTTSPHTQTSHLQNNDVLYFSSLHDHVFPHTQSKKLQKELEKSSRNIISVVNKKHGHILSEAINIFRYDTYLNFLKS